MEENSDTEEKLEQQLRSISSLADAVAFLEEFCSQFHLLRSEHRATQDYLSAVSGFLNDYEGSSGLNKQALVSLCEILFESSFYE